jgi:hypothetical protein
MKALSVRAPWWWFILNNGKDIENRDWGTTRRGRVYVHASKWWSGKAVQDAIYEAHDMGALRHTLDRFNMPEMQRSCGCIVGTVEIVDCVKWSTSPWFQGEHGLVLRDPIALPTPIPFKGMLGFFDVPDFGETEHPSPFPTGVEA